MKKVVFSQHARERMADSTRGLITEAEALAVISDPDVSYFGIDGKQNVLGRINGKRIRICFMEENNQIFVVTVINRGAI